MGKAFTQLGKEHASLKPRKENRRTTTHERLLDPMALLTKHRATIKFVLSKAIHDQNVVSMTHNKNSLFTRLAAIPECARLAKGYTNDEFGWFAALLTAVRYRDAMGWVVRLLRGD